MDNKNTIGSLSYLYDGEDFKENINKVVICFTTTMDKPQFGELIRVSRYFLVLKRRNGSVYTIAKSTLKFLEPVGQDKGGV
jgi:hypothetical protein